MPKARIMVVEDEALVALDLTAKLRQLDYEVPGGAFSGEEAVQQAQVLQPDLVLMDIRLAGQMDGVEAARQIHRSLNIPIVFLTAYSDDPTLERAKSAEPMGYLIKPFEQRELYTTVEMALHRSRAERERAQLAERRNRDQQLEAVNRLTASIVGNFDEQLQEIIGNLDLTLMFEADELQPLVQEARTSAQRVERTIEQLALLYQHELVERRGVRVAEVVREAAEVCMLALPPAVAFRAECDPDLQALGSGVLLRQCLIELLDNAREALARRPGPGQAIGLAVKYLAAGDPQLRLVPQAAPGPHLRIEVADNGPGLDDQVQQRMFEPLFTTKSGQGGMGLGLAVVHGIAVAHGGWVECQSAPGQGATFALCVPAVERGKAAPTAEEPGGARWPTVLVVDDEAQARSLLVRTLSLKGYRAVPAGSSSQALQLMEKHPVDLIVLDLHLPGLINGEELLIELRNRQIDTPVVAVASCVEDEVLFTPPECVQAVLKKPFRLTMLLAEIQEALGQG
jgi:CheY-like chemotaxis protein